MPGVKKILKPISCYSRQHGQYLELRTLKIARTGWESSFGNCTRKEDRASSIRTWPSRQSCIPGKGWQSPSKVNKIPYANHRSWWPKSQMGWSTNDSARKLKLTGGMRAVLYLLAYERYRTGYIRTVIAWASSVHLAWSSCLVSVTPVKQKAKEKALGWLKQCRYSGMTMIILQEMGEMSHKSMCKGTGCWRRQDQDNVGSLV